MDVLVREQKKDKKYKALFQNCSSIFLFQLIMSAWEHVAKSTDLLTKALQ